MTLILLLLLSSELPQAPNMTRPAADIRRFGNLVAREGGFDAYWTRTNELRTPVRNRVLTSPIGTDGSIHGPTKAIREDESIVFPGLSKGTGTPLVFWVNYHNRRTLFASALAGAALEVPAGQRIGDLVDTPVIACGAIACAALWYSDGRHHLVFLDREASMIGAPVDVPATSEIHSLTVDDHGVMLIRATLDEERATRIAWDGVIVYDVVLFTRDALRPENPSVAVAYDGVRHAIAFIPVFPAPAATRQQVHSLTVNADGAIERLGVIFAPESVRHELAQISLAWNGSRYLLAGTYLTEAWVHGLYALELDDQLRAVGFAEQTAATTPFAGAAVVAASHDAFAIGWASYPPSVSVYRSGAMTEPVPLSDVPEPRRRAAGH
jgi:hypothetical protein